MFAEGVRDLALPDLHVHPPLHPPRRPQPLDLHVSGRYHLFRVFLTKTLSHFFSFALLYMSMMLQGDQEGHGNS